MELLDSLPTLHEPPRGLQQRHPLDVYERPM